MTEINIKFVTATIIIGLLTQLIGCLFLYYIKRNSTKVLVIFNNVRNKRIEYIDLCTKSDDNFKIIQIKYQNSYNIVVIFGFIITWFYIYLLLIKVESSDNYLLKAIIAFSVVVISYVIFTINAYKSLFYQDIMLSALKCRINRKE